jgi:prepilin-type N-terminal cleavage/methylation domain-containing protein
MAKEVEMKQSAFTLVEMLVVVAITATVIGISVPVAAKAIESARKAKEISAARKLVAAYLEYAADHDGFLMAGYKDDPATDAVGAPLSFPSNARYPWRLAPYLDYDMHTILFNGNENALKDEVDFHYATSVTPNLGMNTTFVGGDFGSSSDLEPNPRSFARFGNFCITRLSQATKPSSLIVFASARRGENQVGCYQIKSPNLNGTRWSGSFNPKGSGESYGFLDMRYGKHAVAAMLDGHIALLSEDEVKDMRRWSNQAAEQDNPNFTLKRIQ